MFKKILIANRGEIAHRIIKACRELNIISAAIFSEADKIALHVRRADEAYLIGASPANESYLNKEKIINLAKNIGADAIHPGYGFLSENSEFLKMVEESGIVFIDEIDKIAGAKSQQGPDVSREGVQRDLLPIVEGSTVNTKYGPVKPDHVLFIASGAFHVSKPSDLIPELQGRFPIVKELARPRFGAIVPKLAKRLF